MKRSLKNDAGLRATKPAGYPSAASMGVRGPSSAPQERLLAGKAVAFRNAEPSSAEKMKSYYCEE